MSLPLMWVYATYAGSLPKVTDTMVDATQSMSSFNDLRNKLREILRLDWDTYNGIRDTRDGEAGNPLKDTEVMVKFHVLPN